MSDAVPKRPDCYWVEPRRFLAGEYRGTEEAAAREKLQALVEAGVRVFVDLTEEGEQNLRPYAPLLEDSRAVRRTGHHRLPIRDVSVPMVACMREIQTVINESIAAGRPVYVHCWGGTGRTGTVVGPGSSSTGVPAGTRFARSRNCAPIARSGGGRHPTRSSRSGSSATGRS